MLSIWEKESLLSYDIIIVGAGITGLSTAASLKERRKDLSVLVLERGLLPTGASTKNAGFACFGSLSELIEDEKNMGTEAMLDLVEKRWKGLLLTRKRLGDQTIDFHQHGGYELVFGTADDIPGQIENFNQKLSSIFPSPVFSDHTSQLPSFGFAQTERLLLNQFEGQIDTGKMMSALWQYCTELGVKILTGAMVTHVENNAVEANLRYRFEAGAVIVCTNAFTPGLVDVPLLPGRGMVMAVNPATPLKFKGAFHYDQGYYYFRDHGHKLIFGGGRNLDFEGETSTLFEINKKIQLKLQEDLANIILPGITYTIEHLWTGIMAFGDTKSPIVERSENGVYLGVRLGGMGVAIGSLVGEELAEMVLQGSF
ncbi:MAG: FAD-binding oxidoreductase [Cyclobacteriaceae bacterium]|nr:FAD-binding oxidoreductase [Cyclobacteriaceae bacterium]